MVLLVDVGQGVETVQFNLTWENPPNKQDYLDGSCLLYGQNGYVAHVDYHHVTVPAFGGDAKGNVAVMHSGDQPRPPNGWTHVIQIQTQLLPDTVDYLFFSLSAWNSPNIKAYGRPDVQIVDAEHDGHLAGYQIARAGEQQAVIMCAMFRAAMGWRVVEVERFCAGNARNYTGIQQACAALMRELTP